MGEARSGSASGARQPRWYRLIYKRTSKPPFPLPPGEARASTHAQNMTLNRPV